MKLPGFFEKPRWQSKDDATRRAAVAHDDDAELIAQLARLAREDVDAGVRIAALKRLADPRLAQDRAMTDADASVRAESRRLWFDLIAGAIAGAPSSEECLRLMHAQDDAELIEHVARRAPDASLREAAIGRVVRDAALADIATSDSSPRLRLVALERIGQIALLDRIAERTRKTDKSISRRARDRAGRLRIASGDANAAIAHARAICETLEASARAGDVTDEAGTEADWHRVEAHVDDGLRARYRSARALLDAIRRGPRDVADDAAPEPPRDPTPPETSGNADEKSIASPETSPAPDAASSVHEPAPPAAESVIAKARFEASLGDARADRERAAHKLKAELDRIEQALAAFEEAIEAGGAAAAHAAHATLAELRGTSARSLPKGLGRRASEAERRYAELSRWQHWSDNQRRRQLCDEVDALAGSGLHPDALATRVREAQAEWSRLDALEGHAGQPFAAGGTARRFHAACRRALEPARAYFRQREAVRKTHGEEVRAAIERAQAIPDASEDWTQIAAARRSVVEHLRALDGVDPHKRKRLAQDLKSELKRLDALLDRRDAAVDEAKAALIDEARALADAAPERGAAAAAKALQQRWREAGRGKRRRDDAQWRDFRGAIDRVFANLDAARAERNARGAELGEQAAALCAELEALAARDDAGLRGDITRIESAWDALGVRDEILRRRFRAARAALRESAERRSRADRRRAYDQWLARHALVRRAERSHGDVDALKTDWDAIEGTAIAMRALGQRFDAALAGELRTGDADRLRDVLIRIEILAGLESAPEDAERRREIQVRRLSARLGARGADARDDDLDALLEEWTRLGAAPEALDERLDRAVAKAVDALR